MRLLLLVSVFLTGSIMKVGAIDVSPYSETFTGLSTSKHDFAPVGWGHIVDYFPIQVEVGEETMSMSHIQSPLPAGRVEHI